MSDNKNIGNENIEIKYIASTEIDTIQELIPEDGVKKPDTWFLYFTVCTALLVLFTGTSSLVWASPAVVKLKSTDIDVNPLGRPITTVEISMLLGIPILVAIFGTCFLPNLADIVGRKVYLQLAGFGIFVSIVLLAFSTKIELMILFLSISLSIYCSGFALLPIYLTEVCEDHNRSRFGCLISIFTPLGNLFTYIVGPTFSFRNFTLITSTPLILFLIFFTFTPETPVYLLKKGRTKDCMEALRKLRCNKSDKELEIDFNNISKTVTIQVDHSKKTNIFNLFKTKEIRMGIILATVPLLVRIFSGVLVVMSLLAPIFNEAGTNLSGDRIAIIVGIVSVFSAIFPCLVVEKFGKKPLLLISTVASGLCVSILGLFFFLKHVNSSIIYQMQWLPVVCVSLYIIVFAAGLNPIPLAIMGELFLPDVRSTCVAIAATASVVSYCLLSFSYPLLAEAFGTHWCLWIFASCCFLGAILMYKILPETKGKTILEIQEILKQY